MKKYIMILIVSILLIVESVVLASLKFFSGSSCDLKMFLVPVLIEVLVITQSVLLTKKLIENHNTSMRRVWVAILVIMLSFLFASGFYASRIKSLSDRFPDLAPAYQHGCQI